MARLSRAQEAARQRIVQLAARTLSSRAASDAILDALQPAISSDVQTLFGVDPSSLLFNRTLACTLLGESERRNWLRNIYLVREPAPEGTFVYQMRAGISAVAFLDRQEMCWGARPQMTGGLSGAEWRRAYHEIQTPGGGILRASFAVDGRWIAALEASRLDPARPYRPTDVAFMRLMAPCIGRILHAALTRERAFHANGDGDAGEGHDRPGVLVLTASGRVQYCTPAAESWIGLLRRLEPISGSELPTAVLSAVAGLRAAADGQSDRGVLVRTPAGRLRIEASVGEGDGSTAVVLAPQRPPAPPQFPPDWPLTQQERRVAALLLRGLSNRQIATALVVSVNTVESHLAHIYEKLDVRSRTELMACFFRAVHLAEAAEPPPADPLG